MYCISLQILVLQDPDHRRDHDWRLLHSQRLLRIRWGVFVWYLGKPDPTASRTKILEILIVSGVRMNYPRDSFPTQEKNSWAGNLFRDYSGSFLVKLRLNSDQTTVQTCPIDWVYCKIVIVPSSQTKLKAGIRWSFWRMQPKLKLYF